MGGARQDLEAHVARLHGSGRLRVWSIIITFFGDAVAPRGGRVALATLQDAMVLIRIEPGAVRTALSRLAGDGWVAREREGRASYYQLTPQGRFAFDEATRRIYAGGPPEWDGTWSVVVAPPGTEVPDLGAQGYAPLSPGTWLKPGPVGGLADELGGDVLVITGTRQTGSPHNVSPLWQLDDLAARYRSFTSNWQDFNSADLGPAEAIAARTLLIHDWRRIVLHDPGLPYELLPQDWPGYAGLDLVRATYATLLTASEAWLNEAGLAPRAGQQALDTRFNMLRDIAE